MKLYFQHRYIRNCIIIITFVKLLLYSRKTCNCFYPMVWNVCAHTVRRLQWLELLQRFASDL